MIKSPKLYFTDVGLASYLLGIETTDQISRDPLRGNLVENLVILELMKSRLNKGLDPQLYYFRDTHGHEVDCIFQSGHQLVPIEIKAGKTFSKDFLKNLYFFKTLVDKRCEKGFVIYAGSQEASIEEFKIINYQNSALALEVK
jgi:predicted AAA+ superfamily ATPase